MAFFGLGNHYALVTCDCPFPSLTAFEIDSILLLFAVTILFLHLIDLYSARKQNYKNPAVLSAFMILHTSFVHVSNVIHAYCTVLGCCPK